MKKLIWKKPRVFGLFGSDVASKTGADTAEFVTAFNQSLSTVAGSTCTLINSFYSPVSGAPLGSRCATSDAVKSTGGNNAHINAVLTALGPVTSSAPS